MLPKPIMEHSRGTEIFFSSIAYKQPMAMVSLVHRTAVGRTSDEAIILPIA